MLGISPDVMGTAATLYAAVTVTGKNIKDETITGRDVKNRSLGTSKLSATAVSSLTGQRDPAGPQGEKGESGPVGPTGAPGRNTSSASATTVYAWVIRAKVS
jgi:hypothetical protein